MEGVFYNSCFWLLHMLLLVINHQIRIHVFCPLGGVDKCHTLTKASFLNLNFIMQNWGVIHLKKGKSVPKSLNILTSLLMMK
jgi:hypothetical protein